MDYATSFIKAAVAALAHLAGLEQQLYLPVMFH
jgi:hypothetical protein